MRLRRAQRQIRTFFDGFWVFMLKNGSKNDTFGPLRYNFVELGLREEIGGSCAALSGGRWVGKA